MVATTIIAYIATQIRPSNLTSAAKTPTLSLHAAMVFIASVTPPIMCVATP